MKTIVRKGMEADIEAVTSLYRSLVGTEGCTWDEEYPGRDEVVQDVEAGVLYVLCTEDGEIIGAMAAGVDEELWNFDFWSMDIKSHCGCARLGILAKYQNQGLAKVLFSAVEEDVVKRGFDGIGFLVSPNNPAALAVYRKMGYVKVGEAWMFGQDWYCYEKKLEDSAWAAYGRYFMNRSAADIMEEYAEQHDEWKKAGE